MEKDKRLQEIIRDYGISSAPDGFTEKVMKRIETEVVRQGYKPILNRPVMVVIGAIFILILAGSILTMGETVREPWFILPEIDLKLNLPDISPMLTAGFLAGIVSVFFLLLSETGVRSRRG